MFVQSGVAFRAIFTTRTLERRFLAALILVVAYRRLRAVRFAAPAHVLVDGIGDPDGCRLQRPRRRGVRPFSIVQHFDNDRRVRRHQGNGRYDHAVRNGPSWCGHSTSVADGCGEVCVSRVRFWRCHDDSDGAVVRERVVVIVGSCIPHVLDAQNHVVMLSVCARHRCSR